MVPASASATPITGNGALSSSPAPSPSSAKQTELDLDSELSRSDSLLLGTELNQHARRSSLPARAGARGMGGLSCLIICRDAGFALALARAAEVQHVAATLIWSVAALTRPLLFKPDLILVGQDMWSDLAKLLQVPRADCLAEAQILLLGEHRSEGEDHVAIAARYGGWIYALVGKDAGAQAAIHTGLRALREESAVDIEPAPQRLPPVLDSGLAPVTKLRAP